MSTWFWLDLDLCGGAVKYYIIQPEVLAIFVRVTVSSRPKWDVNVEKKLGGRHKDRRAVLLSLGTLKTSTC